MEFAGLESAAIAMSQFAPRVAKHFLAMGNETQQVGLDFALLDDTRHAQVAGGAVDFVVLQLQVESLFVSLAPVVGDPGGPASRRIECDCCGRGVGCSRPVAFQTCGQ